MTDTTRYFTTVGELKEILSKYKDDLPVHFYAVDGCAFAYDKPMDFYGAYVSHDKSCLYIDVE